MPFYRIHKWRWFTYVHYNVSAASQLIIRLPEAPTRFLIIIAKHYEGRRYYIAVQMKSAFGLELAWWFSGKAWKIFDNDWHYDIRMGCLEIALNKKPDG